MRRGTGCGSLAPPVPLVGMMALDLRRDVVSPAWVPERRGGRRNRCLPAAHHDAPPGRGRRWAIDGLGVALPRGSGGVLALCRRWPGVPVVVVTAVLRPQPAGHYPGGPIFVTAWISLFFLILARASPKRSRRCRRPVLGAGGERPRCRPVPGAGGAGVRGLGGGGAVPRRRDAEPAQLPEGAGGAARDLSGPGRRRPAPPGRRGAVADRP